MKLALIAAVALGLFNVACTSRTAQLESPAVAPVQSGYNASVTKPSAPVVASATPAAAIQTASAGPVGKCSNLVLDYSDGGSSSTNMTKWAVSCGTSRFTTVDGLKVVTLTNENFPGLCIVKEVDSYDGKTLKVKYLPPFTQIIPNSGGQAKRHDCASVQGPLV